MQNNLKWGRDMKAETDDGCSCPRCLDHIPEEFYCRTCGYVPNWRQRAYEEHQAWRERRMLEEPCSPLGAMMCDAVSILSGETAVERRSACIIYVEPSGRRVNSVARCLLRIHN